MEESNAPAASAGFKFGKEERLRHKILVDGVFAHGASLYDYPLRLNYRAFTSDELDRTFRADVPDRIGRLQMLVTVPKRKRKHAVDRVLMRRRIREAYRLNRLPLLERAAEKGIRTLSLAFVYLHDDNMPYDKIERKMQRLLGKLNDLISREDDR